MTILTAAGTNVKIYDASTGKQVGASPLGGYNARSLNSYSYYDDTHFTHGVLIVNLEIHWQTWTLIHTHTIHTYIHT